MACASCCVQSSSVLLQCTLLSHAPCSRQAWPHLKVPMLQLPRRMASQQSSASLAAAVLDSASTRRSFSAPRVGRSSRSQNCYAVMSASVASSSASKPTARKQLDQFFDILSSKEKIMTAQCWSFADYQEFEDRIRSRGAGADTIGCCYFAGQEAESLAQHGYVELIYTSFDQDDDLADRPMAELIYNTALACNLPIEKDDDYCNPGLKITRFDPEEFAEERGRLESFEYDNDGTLRNLLLFKGYKTPGRVTLFDDLKLRF